MFGATKCACGYDVSSSENADRTIELSYLEALRDYWRVYWPLQLFSALALVVPEQSLFEVLVPFVLAGVGLYLFVGRIVSRSYRGFSIRVSSDDGTVRQRLTRRERLDVWAFLWWRQLVASLLGGLLSAPLNALLSLFGIRVTQWIAVAAGVLVIGPILLKMLIGHRFGTFQLLARRAE
jgi:hypothetical protein